MAGQQQASLGARWKNLVDQIVQSENYCYLSVRVASTDMKINSFWNIPWF